MSPWEIEKVEEMTEDEQKEYYKKLIKKYKDLIKDARQDKRFANFESICVVGWRVALAAAAIGVLGGPTMAAIGGKELLGTIGGILMISSIPALAAALFGQMVAEDLDLSDVKDNFVAAQESREDIREFRKEIKEIKRKPVMRKR